MKAVYFFVFSMFFSAVIVFVSCSENKSKACVTLLDCPPGHLCNNGVCVEGETGNTGNTGDTGEIDTGDTGDTGNTGNTGDSGNTGSTTDGENEDDHDTDKDEEEVPDENDDPFCGNNKLEEEEECDKGDANSNLPGIPYNGENDSDAGCRTDCKWAYCGDGIADGLQQYEYGNEVVIYHFDSSAVDSKSGFDGTDVNIEWNGGRFGQSAYFSGTESYIEVPDKPELRLGAAMAVEFWVKTDWLPSSWARIVGKSNGGENRNFGIYIHLNGTILFQVQDSIDLSFPGIQSITDISDGKWHHVAATYDGAEMKLYIDHVLEASSPYSGIPFVSETAPLRIGGDGVHEYFTGSIDELRILNRAISMEEILAIPREICDNGVLNGQVGMCKEDCSGYL